MLQKGIIVLAINHHHLTVMILKLHPVAHLFEMLISQAILSAEVIKSKSSFSSSCPSVAQNLIHQAQVILIQLDPSLYIAFHLLGVEEPLVSGKPMIRQIELPAEVRNF